MALRMIEGFDGYLNTVTLLRKRWNSLDTGIAFEATNGRRSSGCVNLGFNGELRADLGGPRTTCIAGVAVNIIAPHTAVANIVEFYDANSSLQTRFRIELNGTVTAQRGTTTVLTSSESLTPGVYTYLEVKAVIDNASGLFEIRFDNENVGTFVGDTRQLTDFIIWAQFRGGTGAGFRIDDIYVADDLGSENNDFLGDCRVDTIFPLSDTITEWNTVFPASPTTHFDKVDDSTDDADATYVETPDNNERELFALGALPVHPVASVPLGVQLNCMAQNQQNGDRTLRHIVRPVATIFNQPVRGVTAENYHLHENILALNPETGNPWSEAEINATHFGMEVA